MDADPATSQVFKKKVDLFVTKAGTDLASKKEELQEAKNKFKSVMRFYQFIPKGTTLETAEPHDFFNLWLGFCRDFKVLLIFKMQANKQITRILDFTGYLEKGTAEDTKRTNGGNSQEAWEQTRSCKSEIKSTWIKSAFTKINN